MAQQIIVTGAYCIDTSALIDLWRSYPRDIFAGLWRNLERLASGGNLIAPHEVLKELEQKEDELLVWAMRNRKMFIDLDSEQQQLVRGILRKYPTLLDPGKSIPDADPFVVALGRKGYTVVTQEKARGPGGPMKIPDVCAKESVKCVTLHQMFREERWEF